MQVISGSLPSHVLCTEAGELVHNSSRGQCKYIQGGNCKVWAAAMQPAEAGSLCAAHKCDSPCSLNLCQGTPEIG